MGDVRPERPPTATVLLQDAGPGDGIVWKWTKGAATTPAELGSPLAADGYALCIYGAASMLVSASAVPPGGVCRGVPCWKDLGGNGFKYVDKDRTHDGVLKAVLHAGGAGKAKVVVKARGDLVTLPPLPAALPLRVQLQGTNGQCWEATFDTAGQLSSSATQFKGKGQ